MIAREVRLLFRKEVRQVVANRTAFVTSFIPQVLFLLVIPQLLIGATQRAARPGTAPPIDLGLIGDVGANPQRLAISILPLFISVAGITAPLMLAVHSLVSERETRTLDLMMSLPIRVSHLLQAKALAVTSLAYGIACLFLSVTGVELVVLGLASPLEALALFVELAATVACGTVTALAVGFHAPDFRTAQNVTPAYILPALFAGIVLSMLVGGGATRPLTLAGFYALWAAVLVTHAARQRSFEQLLR